MNKQLNRQPGLDTPGRWTHPGPGWRYPGEKSTIGLDGLSEAILTEVGWGCARPEDRQTPALLQSL